MRNPKEIALKIKQIAKEKEIFIKTMLSDCELSVNTLSSMQSRGTFPSLETISKIADYLGVSTDYLLGRDVSINTQMKFAIFGNDDVDDETLEDALDVARAAAQIRAQRKK